MASSAPAQVRPSSDLFFYITRTASNKSSIIIWPLPRRIAQRPASVSRFRRSAPLKPSLIWTMREKSHDESKFILRPCIFRISKRPTASGKFIWILRDIRPGRRNAGSSDCGLFVQNTHLTRSLDWSVDLKPSSSVRRASIALDISLSDDDPDPERLPHIESTSSIIRIVGAWSLAYWNISLMSLADSPMYF